MLDYLSGDGYLDINEYRALLCQLVFDDEFLKNVISESDTDGDGLLSVKELAEADAFNFEFVHYEERKNKWIIYKVCFPKEFFNVEGTNDL